MKHFDSLYPKSSRFNEIEKIITFLKEGNSCQLIGLPGSGKSNLLRMLAYNHDVRLNHFGENQKFVHFVYTNFSEVFDKSLFDVNKYIFISIADSLRDRGMEAEHKAIHKIFKEHLSLNDELILFQGLKEVINYLAIEKKLSIILLFDRFKDYVPFLNSEFFANLRILRNIAKYRFSVIVSLNRPLEETLKPEVFSHFDEFLAEKFVYLPLADEQGLNFRINYLEKQAGKKLNKELIKKVINLTGGHSKLTKLCVETLFENEEKNKKLKEFLLAKKMVQLALFEIWNFLTQEEKEQIKKVKEVNDLMFLEKIGLIKNSKISIPLFKLFIEKNLYKSQINEKIIFDKMTNTIILGEKIISNDLTSLEFNLLIFLIENEGKILGRDEIINAVWKNNFSITGVTDQALDQLFFRLRKKIEQDPSKPHFLQSIKGRGFKFNS